LPFFELLKQLQSKEDFCQKFICFQAFNYHFYVVYFELKVNAHYSGIALKDLIISLPFELRKVDLNVVLPTIFLLLNHNSIQVFLSSFI
jgi:hypothetical protein